MLTGRADLDCERGSPISWASVTFAMSQPYRLSLIQRHLTGRLRPQRLRFPAMPAEEHITQATYDRLSAELLDLRTRGRIDLADRIERAREHGDLKENAEYHAAKDDKAKMEQRIVRLATLLERAVILPDDASSSDTVVTGSTVTIRYVGDDPDEVEQYLIGSIEERHGDVNVVSPTAPLGEALLGAAVGDTVTYAAPRGELQVEVVAID
jgi:transcription elongation factor GreA